MVALTWLAVSACEPARSSATSAAEIAADDPLIRYVGRFDGRQADAPRCSWSGSQIEASFTGTFLRAVITDTPVEDAIRETDFLTVVIDDRPPRVFALTEGRRVYPLASGLAPGSHRLAIWKRSEAEVGVVTFHGFQLEPGHALVRASKLPTRRLEFVGDSITAGYGNQGPDASCPWSARSEDNYLTYGAHAARELGADYTAVAWSGKGLTRNYEARDKVTVPQLYDRIIPTDMSAGTAPLTSPADAVVVNLGTNDVFAAPMDGAELTKAYFEFLQRVRRRHPNSLLVIALGPMLADDYPRPNARTLMRTWLRSVEADWRARVDERIDFIELWSDPAEGFGCDFHPNSRSHARFGKELAQLLRTRLTW
jgi:lysophospholipase L1-like esterase